MIDMHGHAFRELDQRIDRWFKTTALGSIIAIAVVILCGVCRRMAGDTHSVIWGGVAIGAILGHFVTIWMVCSVIREVAEKAEMEAKP